MKTLMSSDAGVAAFIKALGIETDKIRSVVLKIEAGKPVVVEVEKYVEWLPVITGYTLVEKE